VIKRGTGVVWVSTAPVHTNLRGKDVNGSVHNPRHKSFLYHDICESERLTTKSLSERAAVDVESPRTDS
jgi:hypothetical protein